MVARALASATGAGPLRTEAQGPSVSVCVRGCVRWMFCLSVAALGSVCFGTYLCYTPRQCPFIHPGSEFYAHKEEHQQG